MEQKLWGFLCALWHPLNRVEWQGCISLGKQSLGSLQDLSACQRPRLTDCDEPWMIPHTQIPAQNAPKFSQVDLDQQHSSNLGSFFVLQVLFLLKPSSTRRCFTVIPKARIASVPRGFSPNTETKNITTTIAHKHICTPTTPG